MIQGVALEIRALRPGWRAAGVVDIARLRWALPVIATSPAPRKQGGAWILEIQYGMFSFPCRYSLLRPAFCPAARTRVLGIVAVLIEGTGCGVS